MASPKKIMDPQITREIKKEYLQEHLKEVKGLVGQWMEQMAPQTPLRGMIPQFLGIWQKPYMPALENDPDQNHMLRKHLKSRALWKHHSDWERQMSAISDDFHALQQQVNKKHDEISQVHTEKYQYTDHYISTALWLAFERAAGRNPTTGYTPHEEDGNPCGLYFGAHIIETSASSLEEREQLRKDHSKLSYSISKMPATKGLMARWKALEDLQQRMQQIVGKALKANDLLYPCRFCKHLWE